MMSERVIVDQPEMQNLLALLLRNILEANMADDAKYSKVSKLEGDVQVQAGQMVVTMRFGDGRLTLVKGPSESPRASVRGDMGSFLEIARGGGVVVPFLSGAVSIGGNPFVLLKLMPLLKVPEGEVASPDVDSPQGLEEEE